MEGVLNATRSATGILLVVFWIWVAVEIVLSVNLSLRRKEFLKAKLLFKEGEMNNNDEMGARGGTLWLYLGTLLGSEENKKILDRYFVSYAFLFAACLFLLASATSSTVFYLYEAKSMFTAAVPIVFAVMVNHNRSLINGALCNLSNSNYSL